ncbi:MAG: DUF4124 domain-containing protein [Desulfobacterales bacterium]|nr:DUF4124 domain-containing protein [Desulfobacterales bacterium]
MHFSRSRTSIFFLFASPPPLFSSISVADIYKYVDEEGVMHFTDAPTDRRFKIFMRDLKKDRKLRTNFKIGAFCRNPAEFEPIVKSVALEYGVDKNLVKAVIHAESGYNPKRGFSKRCQRG